jgi:hypothetical protein
MQNLEPNRPIKPYKKMLPKEEPPDEASFTFSCPSPNLQKGEKRGHP